jgi:glycosyltransferase involved in cell wall biosynthesis
MNSTENISVDVTIFVPCYNEEKNVINTFKVIESAFVELGLSYEIIAMDDGSKDNTAQVIQEYIHTNSDKKIYFYRQPRNMGLAYNFADAAFLGKGKYFRQVNGDNDDSKENLIKLFSNLGKADIIIPYLVDATARRHRRRIISSIYTKIINLINGYNLKYYNGMAVYLRAQVMRWHSHTHGFGYQAELLTCLLDKHSTYIEVPVIALSRASGESKAFSLMNILSIVHTAIKLLLKRVSFLYHNKIRARHLKSEHV